MGSVKSKKILVITTSNNCYFTGDVISGTVQVSRNSPKGWQLTINHLNIQLVGILETAEFHQFKSEIYKHELTLIQSGKVSSMNDIDRILFRQEQINMQTQSKNSIFIWETPFLDYRDRCDCLPS
jgi:hypothetical protein